MVFQIKAKMFVLEGCDGCSKSTQTILLVKHLKNRGFRVAHVKAPWNDHATYNMIYWMLRNGYARLLPNVFQIIQFLNKLLFQVFVLPTLLCDNDYIIFDRWKLSMWTYGIADNANVHMTEFFLRHIKDPDFTVVLDGQSYIFPGVGDSYEKDVKYQNVV